MELLVQLFFICTFMSLEAKTETVEELTQKYANTMVACAHQYKPTSEDVTKMQNKQVPEGESAKCMLACVYRATGMMDANGMLDVEHVKKITEEHFSGEPEKLTRANQFNDACKVVNEQAVSDGNKGCERAALIFKCSVEQAPLHDFI
ncbi:hypothetical protein ACJJTC_009528 [Scirpophaga incertulas]